MSKSKPNSTNNSGPTGPTFGQVQYTKEEHKQISSVLSKQLGPEFISKRAGPGNSQVTYIEGWKAIELANDVLGFNGWSHSITDTTVDYVDIDPSGRVSLGISATVRVTLKDGTFHEDVGYGSIENAKNKSMAFEKARKEAVTDGLKRGLKAFGNVLGNCLYDKEYIKKIQKVKFSNKQLTLDPHSLHRHSSFRETNDHPMVPLAPLAPVIKNEALPFVKQEQVLQPMVVKVQPQLLKEAHMGSPCFSDGFVIEEEDAIFIAADLENMDMAMLQESEKPPVPNHFIQQETTHVSDKTQQWIQNHILNESKPPIASTSHVSVSNVSNSANSSLSNRLSPAYPSINDKYKMDRKFSPYKVSK